MGTGTASRKKVARWRGVVRRVSKDLCHFCIVTRAEDAQNKGP
jgi:hypothetical protein